MNTRLLIFTVFAVALGKDLGPLIQANLAGPDSQHRVSMFGADLELLTTDKLFGLAAKFNADIGIGYTWPFYSSGQYLINNPTARIWTGGRQTLQLNLYFIRFLVHFDLNIAAPSLNFKSGININSYDGSCTGSGYVLDMLQVKVLG